MQLVKQKIPSESKIYTPRRPFMARVLSNEQLVEEGGDGDVRKIVLDLVGSDISYLEGQSFGVVAPGIDEEGKPHRARLYSIASAVDEGQDQATLCVKRVHYRDSETNEEVRGVCSNYLCDLKLGDQVPLTGPMGRRFLLPEDPSTDLILIAVGVGVAPFRAFFQVISGEQQEKWKGEVHFFFGSRTRKELLCVNRANNEIAQVFEIDSWKLYAALSRLDESAEKLECTMGRHIYKSKGYVQDLLREHIDQIWPLLERGNFSLYLCGMKGVEQSIEAVVRDRAQAAGYNWSELREQWNAQGRWNLEVY